MDISSCLDMANRLSHIEGFRFDAYRENYKQLMNEYTKYEKQITVMIKKYFITEDMYQNERDNIRLDREEYTCKRIYPICDKIDSLYFRMYQSIYKDVIYSEGVKAWIEKLFEFTLYTKDIFRNNVKSIINS